MSTPFVLFKESISTNTVQPFFVRSPDQRHMFWLEAEPLNPSIIEAIEARRIGPHIDEIGLKVSLIKHGWNEHDSRNVLAFGPGDNGTNILVDRTKDNRIVQECFEYITQGFKWSTTQGPLCNEPFHGVKFSLIDCHIDKHDSFQRIGEIQRTFKRGCCGALLSARPILLEAIYKIQVIIPEKYVKSIYRVFLKGRRKLITAKTTDDSYLTVVLAEVPITESIGITNEIKKKSSGKALLVKQFSHYERIPGDPMKHDGGLARQYVEQIRRRKLMDGQAPPRPESFIG